MSTLSRTGGSGSIPGAVHDMRTPGGPLNVFVERAAIGPQEGADLPEPALECRIDVTGRDVDQPGRKVREEPLELQALLEGERGPGPRGAAQREPHHEHRSGDDQRHRRGDEDRVSAQIQIASPLFGAEIATAPTRAWALAGLSTWYRSPAGQGDARASRRAVEAQQVPETSPDVACRAGDQDPRPRRWAQRPSASRATIRSSAPRPSRRTAGAEQRPAARVRGGNGAARAAAAEVVDVAVDRLLAIDIDLEQTGTHEGCARASAQTVWWAGHGECAPIASGDSFSCRESSRGRGRPASGPWSMPAAKLATDHPGGPRRGRPAARGDQGPLPTPRDRP